MELKMKSIIDSIKQVVLNLEIENFERDNRLRQLEYSNKRLKEKVRKAYRLLADAHDENEALKDELTCRIEGII